MLIFLMGLQIISGILVTFYFTLGRFYSNLTIHLDSISGDLFQLLHARFPRVIFFVIYLHMCKGLLVNSFTKIKEVWNTGWVILILTIATAFLGYVLPWGQISLWGATVIINLLRVLPIGPSLVLWVWGGYFVSRFTLKVFYTLHFLLPFVLVLFMGIHITALHFKGSSNSLGLDLDLNKVEFSPNFIYKDILNIIIILLIIICIIKDSFKLLDTENFILATLIVSPLHIKPEWYFLQFYAILRAVPSKVGGVVLFFLSLVALIAIRGVNTYANVSSFKLWKSCSYLFISLNLLLIWLGRCPVEAPYFYLSQGTMLLYFLWFISLFLIF